MSKKIALLFSGQPRTIKYEKILTVINLLNQIY